MNNETLKQLQFVEYEILESLDTFCRKWDIKYSLYAGTMLGTVRHGGFRTHGDGSLCSQERVPQCYIR